MDMSWKKGLVIIINGVVAADWDNILFGNDLDKTFSQRDAVDTDKRSDYMPSEPLICTLYKAAEEAFNDCIRSSNIHRYGINVRYVRQSLKYMCGNKAEIRKCMEDKIEYCTNTDKVMHGIMLEESFMYCDGNDIPADVETFLTDSTPENLGAGCIYMLYRPMWWGECGPYDDYKIPYNADLADGSIYRELQLDWFISCTLSFNPDENIDQCHMSRKNAFAYVVAAMQYKYGFGKNTHYLFSDYMERIQPSED